LGPDALRLLTAPDNAVTLNGDANLKFCYSPASCALATSIAFAEDGIAYEKTKVDLATHTTESGDDFYAINSKG
jgi:hypothetical protein